LCCPVKADTDVAISKFIGIYCVKINHESV